MTGHSKATGGELQQVSLQHDMIVQRENIEIEKEKLKAAKTTARANCLTVIVALVSMFATVFLGWWGQRQKAEDDLHLKEVEAKYNLLLKQAESKFNLSLKEQEAKYSFALKITDIVLNNDDPQVTVKKAEELVEFFPDRLPSNFGESFKKRLSPFDEDSKKKRFLALAAATPQHYTDILLIWKYLYPHDYWVADFEREMQQAKPPPPTSLDSNVK